MSFGNIFNQVRDMLDGDNEQQRPQHDQFGNPLPASQDPYGDPADQQGGFFNQGYGNQPMYDNGQFGNVLPASQDPYGDPADDESSVLNPMPASMDPYGDPADQGQYGNVLPASQDPYGDPADGDRGHQGGGFLDRLLGGR